MRGSAARCLLVMGMVGAASYSAAHLAGNVRAHRQTVFRGLREHVILIRAQRAGDAATPTIDPAQVRLWRSRRQQIFDSFAFYQATSASASLSIARASPNLFDLLGVPLELGRSAAVQEGSREPAAVLSHKLWQCGFASDPWIAGKNVQLGSVQATVVGVLPAGFRSPSGEVDAWILEADPDRFESRPGFLVAHIAPSQIANFRRPLGMFTLRLPDGTLSDFFCTPIEDSLSQPHLIFLFNVVLALLALPAITSLSLGDYRLRSRRHSSSCRLRRSAFLLAKACIILPTVYFLSLDLAYIPLHLNALSADGVQRVSCFLLCLCGLRWTLEDQRKRCPVCLSRLGNAARVGHPSKTFLAWNGTERACVEGHGLLHVPELPTSWFGTPRWLQLDNSWEILFPKMTRD